jgi:hypothetical protein
MPITSTPENSPRCCAARTCLADLSVQQVFLAATRVLKQAGERDQGKEVGG